MLSEKLHKTTYKFKRLGIWKWQQPEWVTDFEKKIVSTKRDFLD